ncbi:hypothetical protein [Eubacterium ramulus]|uniref:hypothetical protein n=1 Tax=Eubacterium ramulus TaxID=39490 RepID=UPI00399B629A
MKKKILYGIVTVALVMGAFLIGRNNANWADNYCKSNLTITDWNTDGSELAMFLSDGTEIYAYKSETIYPAEHKNYVAFDEIESANGNEIITKDGNVYSIKENR